MKKKIGKKIFTLFMAFAILVTYMPFSTLTADATSAVTGSLDIGSKLKSATGDYFSYSGKDAGYMQAYYVSYANGGKIKTGVITETGQDIRKYRVNGDVAY